MKQGARASEREREEEERRALNTDGWLSAEHANRRRRRHLYVGLDHYSFCLFEKQIPINIWRVHWYSIIIVLRKRKRNMPINIKRKEKNNADGLWSSSSSHSSFASIHNNVRARSADEGRMCVLTSSTASLWLISIFYFNMVQLHSVSSFVCFFSSTAVAIQSVLNIVFNICQWTEIREKVYAERRQIETEISMGWLN